ncbi:hypothetical protein NC652_008571 [Populus alba x Populus x berolinensis]|uniref:Uncharacterized protein n=1 Tax=Populus alba x Populus x berolinensis TaxID=444605 RepID=A0AAD6R7W5_9ROSI|nr:hypothetical protein NC652_008571 [Populus alba x Populus x berolinensis]KAJ7003415.1 hypothetical protein NC653_008594 [Populus alba x Populus x berolinensis]KAJ7011387.1 hypothetical protein NC653_001728 [Populus alba x Populus x berolinensis]
MGKICSRDKRPFNKRKALARHL